MSKMPYNDALLAAFPDAANPITGVEIQSAIHKMILGEYRGTRTIYSEDDNMQPTRKTALVFKDGVVTQLTSACGTGCDYRWAAMRTNPRTQKIIFENADEKELYKEEFCCES